MGEVYVGGNGGSSNALRSKLSQQTLVIPAKSVSPDDRWSPDILKRIIEGHESTEIFEECNETKEYDERADNLVNELTKYMNSGRLDSSANELNVLKSNVTKLELDNSSIVHEGEEQMRQEKERYEQRYRHLEKTSQSKLSSKERDWSEEKDRLLESHRDEVVDLEVQVEQMRNDLLKTKETLHDAITDNERLDADLKNSTKELQLEKKKLLRMEKELANHKELKEKVIELEGQLAEVSHARYEEANRIKELERLTKELRDQNDEYVARLEQKPSETGSENSSYLSEYFKTDLHDLQDSYDNQSNDSDKRNAIIYEQEESISNLRRELDAVNRLLEDNNAMSNDRYNRELNHVTTKYESEIADLQQTMESERTRLNEIHCREKEAMIEKYEMKIIDLRKHLFFDKEEEIKQQGTAGEVGALEESYRSQLSKLEEKIILLETEKAEMELNFLNQKAELEQNFRIERAELEQRASSTSREADRSKKYVDFLKEDLNKKHVEFVEEMQRLNKKEKQENQERQQNRIEELNQKHQRELLEVRKSFNLQVSEQEKAACKERSALKEGFSREKSEMVQKFSRERVELEDFLKQEYELEIANKLAELHKNSVEERSQLEERMREEKYELSIALQHEKASSERQLRHSITEIEMKHTEEKNLMLKDFEYDKNSLQNKHQREVAELQQAFSGGEAGLKGKMKEDFTRLIEQRRKEWTDSFEQEKCALLESFSREKGELEAGWNHEKNSMEENFEEERKQLEKMFQNEKQELIERSQKQRQTLEAEFTEETKKLKESREADIVARIERETDNLRQNVDHLETELISLRQQKKELETRNQILELRQLSQQQEAAEISEFQNEKKQMTQKILDLTNSVALLKNDKCALQNEIEEITREKSTILDNSVAEITQLQERIGALQEECGTLRTRLQELGLVEEENTEIKRDIAVLSKECADKERRVQALLEVDKMNESLREKIIGLKTRLTSMEDRERHLQSEVSEKVAKIGRLEEEVQHYMGKIENLEAVHKKEMDAQKERLNMQVEASSTERSKAARELEDLKQQLHKASLSSDRDMALKEKVFNDAKAEVMTLNKKLEEKNRKIRSLEEKFKANEESSALEGQVRNLKSLMSDKDTKSKEERNSMLTKSMRSDALVTDLYLENADLMKQIANAENGLAKAEKQVRQLTDQKRALQRVISKLCHANGIPNEG